MIDFKENIAQKISEVTNIEKEELKTYIEIPPNSDLGDYAFPCFKLAKSLRKAPPITVERKCPMWNGFAMFGAE